MTKMIDLTQQRFGRLVALYPSPLRCGTAVVWACLCDCGLKVYISGYSLRRGASKSCGCLKKEVISKQMTKHGYAQNSLTYGVWKAMIRRCNNPKIKGFKYWGGQGVRVCKRWKDFKNFLKDMGEKPKGLTLDRINPDGNYEPSNCRWATWGEQNNNRRNSRHRNNPVTEKRTYVTKEVK